MNRTLLTKFLCLCVTLLWPSVVWSEPTWPPKAFSCYYGEITDEAVQGIKNFDLLIVHPGEGDNLSPAKIRRMRETGVEKTIVGYISVGESDKSPGGPPLVGIDTTGPTYIDSTLSPALAKAGYPRHFVDQRSYEFGKDGFLKYGPNGKPLIKKGHDGHPDENGVWGSFYVKADEASWKAEVFEGLERLDKLGLDGFFLDTVDTASPWGDYGWTSSGMLNLVEEIRARYPNKRIIANRGLFYLGKTDRYANLIDAVLFESLLTHYNWTTEEAEISPWARWHIQALDDDVIPSQKRTPMHLLVLDYLNPEQPETVHLVQSAKTLLKDTPHCLSFSHPLLKIPGWTGDDLLEDRVPSDWPTVTKITANDGSEPGEFEVEIEFDGPIPADALPDLRVTDRNDLKPERAAQLAISRVSATRENQTLKLKGDGINKNTDYRLFFRLISKGRNAQTPFAWASFTSKSSQAPGQVTGLSSSSEAEGLMVSFAADSLVAKSYRIYQKTPSQNVLVKETALSPVLLEDIAIKEPQRIFVVAVGADGQEGYPSEVKTFVREDVTPPAAPGAVAISGTAKSATFSWDEVAESEGYRLYVVPKGQGFRLPKICKETTITLSDISPGDYEVFLTAVDGDGNQSAPGQKSSWKAE